MLSREKVLERRLERKPEKKSNRRNKIRKQTCDCCGVPKSYICLEHNDYLDIPKAIKRRKFWRQFSYRKNLSRIRYKIRKYFFIFWAKAKNC